jgi:hypothetical protein
MEVLARQPIHIPVELARAGIGLSWQGPQSSAWAEIGGRAYVPTTTRTTNKGIGVMHDMLQYAGNAQPPLPEQSTSSQQADQQEKRHARTAV